MVTVKELIERLKTFDENMYVVIEDFEYGLLMTSVNRVTLDSYTFKEDGDVEKEYCCISA